MSVLQSIIYGLVSGLSSFLPVSSGAHQALMRYLFGVETRIPLQEILVHIGVLFAVIVGCYDRIDRLRREQKLLSVSSRRKSHFFDSRSYFDLRLLKTATVPLVIGSFLFLATAGMGNNLLSLMIFWLLNALILLVADHCRRGNRDSRTMSALDSIIMGVLGALSVFPGISRTGMISAYATARGVDSENAVNWSALLVLPATAVLICLDLFYIVTTGLGGGSAVMVLGYFLSGIASFVGGYLGISLFKVILNHNGFLNFAYYSIGTAMISFFLYLIT